MPITFSQAGVGTAATFLTTLGPGPFKAVLTIAGGTGTTIYLGSSSAVTTTNGVPVTGGYPYPLEGFTTSRGTAVYGVAAAGTITTGVHVSTPQ